MNFTNGAKWIRVDFHLHTKSDIEFKYKDKENDFVKNYINKLKEEKIEIGAITNHNKFDCEQFKALKKKAKKENIYLLPGVELNIAEGQKGIHTLIIFDAEMWLENGNDYINQFLTKTAPIDENEFRNKNGRSDKNLISTIELLNSYNKNYFIVFAHVNQSNGFFEELGSRRLDFFKSDIFQKNVVAIQKFRDQNKDIISDVFKKTPAIIEASDPKKIAEIGKGNKCFIKISDYNFEAIKFTLLNWQSRVNREIPKQENAHIKSIEYIGGKLDGKKIFLNPAMNNLIGIRGSGKSSILETIRYGLDIEISSDASDNNYKNNLVDIMLGSGGKMLINLIDKKGDNYVIKKTLQERSIILKNDEIISSLKPEHIIKLPLYFGQKDLSSIGDKQSTKDFIQRLISKKVEEQQDKSDNIIFKIREIIHSINKIDNDLKKRENIETKIAELEFKIENFNKYGIEEKLEKETIYNKDKRRIEYIKDIIKERINIFAEFLNENDDFNSLKSYQSKENQEAFSEIEIITSNIETIFSTQLKNNLNEVEKLFNRIEETENKFLLKKNNLLEEFSKIKREIELPSDIKADDYPKYKANLENYHLQLKELDKKSKDKEELKKNLNKLLVSLKDSWHKEYDIINKEILAVNNQQDNVKIKSIFKGDKKTFANFIQNIVKGSNIRKQRIENLTQQYNDFIDLYFDFEQKETTSNIDWFSNIFYNNISDFVTYRTPDIFEIEYNGKPLIEHSLGQRASALIVFLLSLHENELIIIDQPEDDLDSQTIYNEVISTIKNLKTTTQFIFATHNPNIPVLGDCEQIFACSYDNSQEEINFIAGGIDTPKIQQKIVDIMEGGEIAFEERKKKYTQWKN